VVLVCDDGVEFSVHWSVLEMLNADYFKYEVKEAEKKQINLYS